jgi:hypothetical protein
MKCQVALNYQCSFGFYLRKYGCKDIMNVKERIISFSDPGYIA